MILGDSLTGFRSRESLISTSLTPCLIDPGSGDAAKHSDIDVKRQGENTDSTLVIPRWTATELSEDLVKMAKPWPFKRIFAGDPLDIQAKFLRIRPPSKGGNGEAEDHASEYEDEVDYND